MKTNELTEDLLLRALEQLGQSLEANLTPEEVRLNIETIGVFRDVNRGLQLGEISMSKVRELAPTFVGVYREVFLREIEEPIHHGDDT